VTDVAIVTTFALSSVLIQPLPWRLLVGIFGTAAGFALILDRIKPPVLSLFKVE
jgi:hypothetical protein